MGPNHKLIAINKTTKEKLDTIKDEIDDDLSYDRLIRLLITTYKEYKKEKTQ
jgi:hypothetical protein